MRVLTRDLLEARCAYLADVEADVGMDVEADVGAGVAVSTTPTGGGSGGEAATEPRVLVRSDATGAMQLYELVHGEPSQVTALADPLSAARYVPGRRQAVIQLDQGGDERHQLYLVELGAAREPVAERAALDALTAEPERVHLLAGVAPDGAAVAYLSNRRNGIDFDLWVCDLATREHRALYTGGGWCMPSSGFSPDGRYVAVERPGPRPLDVDLLLVDSSTGQVRVVLPHPDAAALVRWPAWAGPDVCFVSSDLGRDHAAIVRVDLVTGATEAVPGTGVDCDALPVTSRDGTVLLVVENRNGASSMRLVDTRDCRPLCDVPVAEPGTVEVHVAPPPMLDRSGTRVFSSLTTPRRPAEVWVAAVRGGGGAPRRLTSSPKTFDPTDLLPLEAAHVTSFDGETIPLFVFRPRPAPERASRPPVVVVVHGGPEAQATQSFNPVVQALASSGYGVVVPNVRGSTGYGRRYATLDDRTLRLDSVRDLAAVHAWLGHAGFDPQRAALWGASYGGYMVLAGLAFQPDLWAAGVDVVGISDLVTFLQHTADYRRAHREREYGSLDTDRDFLERASPLRSAERIRAPLFVVHGRNDPRVPVSEAEQLVARLAARGVRCDLHVYEDEGHGLSHVANRVDAYTKAIAFLDDVLGPPRS